MHFGFAVADYPYVYDLEVLCRPVSEATFTTAAAARATTGATTASATIKTNIGTIRNRVEKQNKYLTHTHTHTHIHTLMFILEDIMCP